MDVTLPSSMQRFMIRVGLAKKRKAQRQSSLRHGRSPSRPRSGLVKGRPISAVTAKESVKSARDGGTLPRRSSSKPVNSSSLGARVTSPNSSSDVLVGKNMARTPQPKRAKTFFGTLTNKLRVRAPAPRHTLDNILDEPECAVKQSNLHKRTSRAQAVTIALPNDIASKERRAEALRARGLLPQRSQTLSAIEAEEDRRIDALQVNDLSLSGPDSALSDAREIAHSWRSVWSSLGPTTADAPVNSVPEVTSPFDVSGEGLETSTEEVDLSISGPWDDGPSSVPETLPSGTRHPPVPPLRAASPAGSNDEREARPSRPASLGSPSSEGSTGPAQQSVPVSPCSADNFPVGEPQTEKVGDGEKPSSLSIPALPAPSERPPITEESQVLLPTSSTQRHVSPSRGSEGVPTPRSPRLPPSPRSVLSPRPAPSSPLPIPPDLSVSPQIFVSDASTSYLHPSELDTLTASPTSPTVPSLLCSSSSENSHCTAFTDSGDTLASPASYTMPVKGRRANLSPITVKSSEGGFLCEEIIIETTESFPEDDLDPFAGPSSTAPANLKVDVPAANLRRRRPLAFLGMAKKRASTLDASPNAGISKSASMANLRRSMTSALQGRARPRSTFSPMDDSPQSPTRSPLSVTMHNGASILAQASLIDDDETRRLSELAFM